MLSNAAYIEWFAEEAKRIDGDVIPGATRPAHHGAQAAGRRLRRHHALELSQRHDHPQGRPGARRRLHHGAEARGADAALGPGARRAGRARRRAEGRVLGDHRDEAKPIGEEFCHNPKVAKITFTGSTGVGRWLMKEAADGIKRLSLELGGNAPFIVFDDADLDAAVEGAMASKFRNAGQTCVCANRIYVQESVAEAFAEKLAAKAKALKLGRGTEDGVTQGPLIDDRAVAKMEEHVADALAKGGKVLVGGRRSSLGGTFFEPTVMTGITQAMKVTKEETFAPLAPIIAFKDEAEVIAMANDSEFGLASYFYARDMARVWRVAEALESGMVGVNTPALANEMAPFGGVKQSGLGPRGLQVRHRGLPRNQIRQPRRAVTDKVG